MACGGLLSGSWNRWPSKAKLPSASAQTLDHGGVRLAAALAHRLEAEAAARRLEVVEHRGHQAHAARAERVPDRDGAAARVVLRRVGPELLGPHERDGGERL